MQPYQKPFLTIRQQIAHLESKGLNCGDPGLAAEALHDLGYYRLTAYTYPFRRLLEPSEPRDTPLQFRADEYVGGARLADGVALAKFDAGLRDKVFDGITMLELSLRFQVAHVLGRRDPFGHTARASLDARACDSPPPAPLRHKFATELDYWLDSYDRLVDRASSEDFIQHTKAKYSSEIPIWIAVETFDFGGLTRLYGLLERSDQNAIAKRFGMSDGRLFHRWLIGLGVVRNHCAHHNRLWNRRLSTTLAAVPAATVSSRLHHLSAVTERSKLYSWMAVLGYSLRSYNDTSNWHRTFKTQMSKFPASLSVTPDGDMGFPAGWQTEELWSSPPAAVRTLPTPIQ
ncbi:Abi family protein [Microbacterium sp. 2C]|uniref:Abi family protein n=1 Tax=Microbacterium paulum TaxID=2707006 RepID=UPI0018C34AEB|nr:Abi family protein [Microbacterium paulum]